jgi:S-DNA-T family DNA segregation ATPase FtsK/SpoIIIE
VIVVDEYAELADEAPGAMSDTDSIARLGRAVAVTLVAATQRPTQKAVGQGAVRSQMDTRICFRVRERKDVDLVLGQGMLAAGWHAHTLNAPGKFLVSAPEHTAPRRARAYLVTDEDVARTVARYANGRPELDDVSRDALLPDVRMNDDGWTVPGDAQSDAGEPGDAVDTDPPTSAEDALWSALCTAPDDGADIAELLRASGMSRPTLYRHLAQHAPAGRAIQVSRGRWRATTTGEARDA